MLELKNIHSNREVLGQFFTPKELASGLLKDIEIKTNLVVEPSFGTGNFITALRESSFGGKILGVELDIEYYNLFADTANKLNIEIQNKNFYDFDMLFLQEDVTFIGNPPYRTPAYSLQTHNKYIKSLCKKYEVSGIREEAIFFIMKTCDIIISNNVNGYIYYIVPETIIKNTTKFYKTFVDFLKKYFYIDVIELKNHNFENVSQDLIFLMLKTKSYIDDIQEYMLLNNERVLLDEYLYGKKELITFHEIFKKTYLGSVPCESIFLSIYGETKEHFKNRLKDLFTTPLKNDSVLLRLLSYDDKYHLRVLNTGTKEQIKKKLDIIRSYIKSVKQNVDLSIISNLENYKEIQHRKEVRFYFRHKALKKASFVYEINPNPCKSFYFTGNPSYSSTDYFGFCDYDINRNSSPGACRTVPIYNLEDNIVESFKEYWNLNTNGLSYKHIFDYIIYISGTEWYKKTKKERRRMYFSIPKEFDTNFLKIQRPCR